MKEYLYIFHYLNETQSRDQKKKKTASHHLSMQQIKFITSFSSLKT